MRKCRKILYCGGSHMRQYGDAHCVLVPKATNTHTHRSWVILISFPLQQWLHKRPSLLHYTHIACLVLISRD